MFQTFGLYLVNDILPEGYKLTGAVTKKILFSHMSKLAKAEPEKYTKVITELKALGDTIATYDGISVGLDDIEPDYAARDKIINEAKTKLKSAKKYETKIDILVDAQDQVGDLAMKHKGTMADMARAGGRGNKGQLMKSVASPIIVADQAGRGIPYLIERSYSEGLDPAEYWIAANEARQNVITGQLATSEPGAQGKVLISLVSDLVINGADCGTDNGISLPTDTQEILDRYTAVNPTIEWLEPNELVTSELQQNLIDKKVKEVLVRSPMTCELREGVCQLCQGLDENGHKHPLGTNVGVRAAQALSEPLTQLALSAKHGLRLASKATGPTGLRALVQYMEAPKKFPNKATVSPEDATVVNIREAPQGGYYIKLSSLKGPLYVPVGQKLLVKEGSKVYAGDALSDGTIYPPDVVEHKGMGQGREYLVDSVYNNVFSGETDRRHLELVMKKHLNYVVIDEDDPDGEFRAGDTIDYNALRGFLAKDAKQAEVSYDLIGKYLAKPVLFYTSGTKLTHSVIDVLQAKGIKHVAITRKAPKFTPVVAPMSRVPLYNPDWMQRLNHRLIKASLIDAATYGQKSDIHSFNPIPAYAYGAEFGMRPGPKY